jgi:hypothetical protein
MREEKADEEIGAPRKTPRLVPEFQKSHAKPPSRSGKAKKPCLG